MFNLATRNATVETSKEFYEQEYFFNSITGTEESPPCLTPGLRLYRELVFHRYREAITAMFPIFTEAAGNRVSHALIEKFIQINATSPYIWKMTEEFKEFLLHHPDIMEIPWAEDLLWFEWTEASLFMKEYHIEPLEPFDWNRKFAVSSSAAKRELRYAAHLDFSRQIEETALLLYYDFDQLAVGYRELTPFASALLNRLYAAGPENAMLELCQKYSITGDEIAQTRNICKQLLRELYEKRIITLVHE